MKIHLRWAIFEPHNNRAAPRLAGIGGIKTEATWEM